MKDIINIFFGVLIFVCYLTLFLMPIKDHIDNQRKRKEDIERRKRELEKIVKGEK